MAKAQADGAVELAAENADLKTQLAAQSARMDQILDVLTDQQEQLAKIGGSAAPAGADTRSAIEQELDREFEALADEFKDLPQIAVIERQARHGVEADAAIRLKDEVLAADDPRGLQRKWTLRWVNFGKPGRGSDAKLKRYEKVRWDELADMDGLLETGTKHDDFVRRGDRGVEVLHKIPLKLFAHMKRREAAQSAGLLSSAAGLRNHMANTVASRVGQTGGNADQAGSLVAGKDFHVTVNQGPTERFTP